MAYIPSFATSVLFFLGFIFLVKGADMLVSGAVSVAKRFSVPSIVIGLTIVAFGTSMPEFVVNIFASVNGNPEIAIGNIVGSNIANILLIIGASAVVYPLTTKKNTVWKEIPLSLLAAFLLLVMANDALIDGAAVSELSRIDGIVFLAFFILFMYYIFGISKVEGEDAEVDAAVPMNFWKSFALIVFGLVALAVGGKWIVDGAVAFAQMFGVSESLIGLTIVAVGTSLPEMATSIVAAYRKEVDIAVGNVVGSNIFNIFWILGISALINPLPFTPESSIDVAVAAFASLILFFTMFVGKRHTLERWQGILMIGCYVGYVVWLIHLG